MAIDTHLRWSLVIVFVSCIVFELMFNLESNVYILKERAVLQEPFECEYMWLQSYIVSSLWLSAGSDLQVGRGVSFFSFLAARVSATIG